MSGKQGVSPVHPLLAWLRREALPLLVMLLLLGAARDTLANHYQVPSGSMQPTLQPGDRVAVDMRAYGLRLPFTDVRLLDTGRPQRGEAGHAGLLAPVAGEEVEEIGQVAAIGDQGVTAGPALARQPVQPELACLEAGHGVLAHRSRAAARARFCSGVRPSNSSTRLVGMAGSPGVSV